MVSLAVWSNNKLMMFFDGDGDGDEGDEGDGGDDDVGGKSDVDWVDNDDEF